MNHALFNHVNECNSLAQQTFDKLREAHKISCDQNPCAEIILLGLISEQAEIATKIGCLLNALESKDSK